MNSSIDNKTSAFFPPLTLEDLNSSYKVRPQQQQQFSASMESDFELSQRKLRYLGVDISSLQIVDQQFQQSPQDALERSEPKILATNLQKKYDSHDNSTNYHSNLQNQTDLSMRIDVFRKKILDIQQDLDSHQTLTPTSDPYKVSIHSINYGQKAPSKTPTMGQQQAQYAPYQSKQKQYQSSGYQPSNFKQSEARSHGQNYQNNNPNQSSISSGGLSFQPPQLYSTSNKKVPQYSQFSALSDLEFHKIRYYDSFMPDGQKMMNCPLKLFKHKLQNRNKQALSRCLDEFNVMDLELTQSLR